MDKKEKITKKDNSNLEESDNLKSDIEKSNQEEIEKIEEEMKKMISEMEEYIGSDLSNIKIITIDKKQKKMLKIYSIIEVILSLILLFSSIGYFKWVKCDKLYQYFILFGGIIFLEYLFSYLLKKFALKFIILSFGLILYIAPLLGFIIGISFTPGVNVLSYGLLLVVFILYIIIKKFFLSFIKGDFRQMINTSKF